MAALTSSEEAVLLASTQAALISTPEYNHLSGNAPELLGVGHNPYPCPFFDHSIVLPSSSRRKTLVEFLYSMSLDEVRSGGGEKGMKRKKRLQRLVQMWQAAGLDDDPTASSTQPYIQRGDTEPGMGTSVPYGIELLARDSSLLNNLTSTSSVLTPGSISTISEANWPPSCFNPHKITAFMEGLSMREQKILAAQRFTEYFYESRIAALERYK